MVMPAVVRVVAGHDNSVTVRNVGDAPLYLNISMSRVMNPGLVPEEKVALTELENPGVLANPSRLTLGPGQSRKVTLTALSEPTAETLYRLYIVPARAMRVETAPTDKITAPVSVAIGYGVLVRHLPAPARQVESWTHRCEAGDIVLENTGSVRVVFSQVSVDGASPQRRIGLYPGTPHHIQGKTFSGMIDGQQQSVECR